MPDQRNIKYTKSHPWTSMHSPPKTALAAQSVRLYLNVLRARTQESTTDQDREDDFRWYVGHILRVDATCTTPTRSAVTTSSNDATWASPIRCQDANSSNEAAGTTRTRSSSSHDAAWRTRCSTGSCTDDAAWRTPRCASGREPSQ